MATCVRKIFKKVRPSNFLQGATVLRSTSANLSTTSTGCAYAKVREEEEIPFAQYGGRFRVTMLPGSGIGPEMMGYVKEVFRYAGIPIDFETVNISTSTDSAEDVHHAVSSIKRNGVAIKGNIETRMNEPGIKSRNVILRNELNLFVNVVHCYSQPGIITRHKDVDIAIVRMNIEGEYAMLEHENVPGVIESLKVVTRETSERVARFAYNWAREKGKNKVHIIHKANIMKLSDGLFMDTCKEVSKDYPDIETETMIVDNTCMQLASNPQQFQVMVTPNLYGSIIGNLVCGLVGGAGLFSGRNYGERYAVFEPGTRNTGSSMVGKNIANPHAMLKAGVDLLEHLNLTCHAQLLRDCLWQTINVDRVHTPDLGGYATSLDFVQHVIHHIQEKTKDLNWMSNYKFDTRQMQFSHWKNDGRPMTGGVERQIIRRILGRTPSPQLKRSYSTSARQRKVLKSGSDFYRFDSIMAKIPNVGTSSLASQVKSQPSRTFVTSSQLERSSQKGEDLTPSSGSHSVSWDVVIRKQGQQQPVARVIARMNLDSLVHSLVESKTHSLSYVLHLERRLQLKKDILANKRKQLYELKMLLTNAEHAEGLTDRYRAQKMEMELASGKVDAAKKKRRRQRKRKARKERLSENK